MAEQINDGGPAFPFTPNPQPQNSDGTWSQNWDAGESGMTLRDYFAAKAMASILVNNGIMDFAEFLTSGQSQMTVRDLVASKAYQFADAMLAAREAK